MPRPRNLTPSYLLHKPSDQAHVRVRENGRYRDIFLGEYGTPEAWRKLVSPRVHDPLEKVDGIRKGSEPRLKQPEPVKPVPEEDFWPVVHVASS